MVDEKTNRKTIKLVMVRRGAITIQNVPTQKLQTFIRKKALLGTDEISGDGKNWIRADRHYQLGKFFSNDDCQGNILTAKKNISNDFQFPERSVDMEKDFQEVVDLLRDINH